MNILKYRGFTRCAISEKINYRSRLLMNLAQSGIEAAATFFLWKTLFNEQSVINGYTWNNMVFYIMIAFIMNATLGYGTESNISDKVLSGSIAMDLAKPLNFQHMCFAETIGSSLVEGILAIIAGGGIALLLGDITQVFALSYFGLFFISFVLAFTIKFLISYFAGLCCFFTSNGYGVIYLRQVITDVFSGALLPLSFYPLWFRRLSNVLPFQSIVYLPTQIFLGRIAVGTAWRLLGVQLLWVVFLWWFDRMFFHLAVRKITIQGG